MQRVKHQNENDLEYVEANKTSPTFMPQILSVDQIEKRYKFPKSKAKGSLQCDFYMV